MAVVSSACVCVVIIRTNLHSNFSTFFCAFDSIPSSSRSQMQFLKKRHVTTTVDQQGPSNSQHNVLPAPKGYSQVRATSSSTWYQYSKRTHVSCLILYEYKSTGVRCTKKHLGNFQEHLLSLLCHGSCPPGTAPGLAMAVATRECRKKDDSTAEATTLLQQGNKNSIEMKSTP